MFLIILIKSLIIGALVGVGVGAGAARMFHAPTTQGWARSVRWANSTLVKATRHLTSPLGWGSSLTPGPRLWRPDRSPVMSITASSLTGRGGANDQKP